MTMIRCAIIPAFNAADRLSATLADVAPFVDHMVVVDDGSTDHTSEVAQAHEKTHVVRQARQGPGGAVFAGLGYARRLDADYAVIVDADGQMDATQIPELFALLNEDVDLVRGSRLEQTSGGDTMPWLRRFAANALTLPSSFCARTAIRDPLSGFVALRLTKAPAYLWRGFGYPMHLSAAVASQGGRIEHRAVPSRYPESGVSHHGLHRAPAVLLALVLALRERWR